jgi:transcriptional regulator with XRE-family HTH domain
MNTLATNIRRLRLDKGMSQSCFSIASGFSQSQISDFERGRRLPSLPNLYRLHAVLGCSWDDLLNNPKPNKKTK